MTCLGVLDRGEQGDYNGTSLKEGEEIEMSTTVLHSRAAPSLKYLPVDPQRGAESALENLLGNAP